MNYANHNLRINLQEWTNRLYKADSGQFSHQFKLLFDNFKNNSLLNSLLEDARKLYPYENDKIQKISNGTIEIESIIFLNQVDQCSFCIHLLEYFINKKSNHRIQFYTFFQGARSDDSTNIIIDNYVIPIVNYLHDILDESNSITYLLERYKKRVEWFTRNELAAKYNGANSSYEQILEDDLRLFLFDQGIEYPLSTPKSASGRADIVGQLDSDEPLVLEIKIVDSKRKYGKERIRDGFRQVIKYSNDYSKNIGYLVIFNLDNSEINLKFNEPTKYFPPSLVFGNKTYYFIIINLNNDTTASKASKTNIIEVTEEYLTKGN